MLVLCEGGMTAMPRIQASTELVIDMVCRYFDIPREGLLSTSRERRVAYPRQVAMYLMREVAQCTLVEVGMALGRDHSTIHHGWVKVGLMLYADASAREDISNLRDLIDRGRPLPFEIEPISPVFIGVGIEQIVTLGRQLAEAGRVATSIGDSLAEAAEAALTLQRETSAPLPIERVRQT